MFDVNLWEVAFEVPQVEMNDQQIRCAEVVAEHEDKISVFGMKIWYFSEYSLRNIFW